MARAQDGGFGREELDRASLERGRDINPQPYRVGFKQVMDSLIWNPHGIDFNP